MTDASLIEQSFELAAERCGDITPRVYEKLFGKYPEMLPLFARDTNGNVRGEMLTRTIEAIFDYIGPNSYAENFLRCEVVTHDGYGVPPEIFAKFFDVLAETLRDILGAGWSPAMAREWQTLLNEFARLTAAPEHII
ncbi:MAG TPA: globin [Rhizomicrobium sp.]|jgi:hemoglobin-like flavoprotein